MTESTREPLWRKSSYSSGGNNNCVEVADRFANLAVRDSKNPAGPTLTVPPAGWTTFLDSLRIR